MTQKNVAFKGTTIILYYYNILSYYNDIMTLSKIILKNILFWEKQNAINCLNFDND